MLDEVLHHTADPFLVGVDVPPFFLGYAYEALARAAAVAGNEQDMATYLEKARAAANGVQEADNRKMLLDDLLTIEVS